MKNCEIKMFEEYKKFEKNWNMDNNWCVSNVVRFLMLNNRFEKLIFVRTVHIPGDGMI